MLVPQPRAGARVLGGGPLDLLEQSRALLLLEVRAERTAQGVEPCRHDVGTASRVRSAGRGEGGLDLADESVQVPVLADGGLRPRG